MRSRVARQRGGLPQGAGISCLISTCTEQPCSALLRKTPEQWQAVKDRFPDVPELQSIVAIRGIRLPDGKIEVSYKYADDRWAFVGAMDLPAFAAIYEFCRLGSNTTMNYTKSYVSRLGVGHGEDSCAVATGLGFKFVPHTEDVEVTGIMTGYSRQLVSRMWQDKISRVIRSLRAFARARLFRVDRAVVFRCFAMSVWSYVADPSPPTRSQVRKMEAIQRRFLLAGALPADGAKMLTQSKVSAAEIARPISQGGLALPSVSEWLDSINVKRVVRLLEPTELSQHWTAFAFWWAERVLQPWGAVAATGPASMPYALALCNFLCRFRDKSNILTTSTRVPSHWRARFRSFFRAVQLGRIAPIADCIAAAAEPLWFNSLLQTGRGFWDDSGEYPEATWRAWARAGFHSVHDLLEADGTYLTSTSLPGVQAGSQQG